MLTHDQIKLIVEVWGFGAIALSAIPLQYGIRRFVRVRVPQQNS